MTTADPQLTDSFRRLVPRPRQIAHDAQVLTIELGFDMLDGSALTAGGWYMARIGFPCKIVGAYLYGDVPSSSSISLSLGTSLDWPRTTPISPSSPFSFGGLAYNPLSVLNWQIWLQPADVLRAQLLTVTNGIAHALLAIDVVRQASTSRGIGTRGMTNMAGDRVVDSAGNPVVQRN